MLPFKTINVIFSLYAVIKIDVMGKHLARLDRVLETLIMVAVVAKRVLGLGSALPYQL